MDLGLRDQLFLVGGASSGLGKSIAVALLREGANVVGVSRNVEDMELPASLAKNFEPLNADLTEPGSVEKIVQKIGERRIAGAVINAGGPPAMPVMDTTLEDWDQAYKSVVRWKIDLSQRLIQSMMLHSYGRLVFVESVSVKQPLENLVLSNAMRLAVVGFVKTISQEIAATGITLNILGPSFHDTPRLHSLIAKNAHLQGVSEDKILQQFQSQAKVGSIGDPDQFASLALWLLSPLSSYVTGQTISVDGGFVKGTMG